MPGTAPAGRFTLCLIRQAAFGEFSFDTAVADPTVTMRVVSDEGKELYQVSLSLSQLTPSAP